MATAMPPQRPRKTRPLKVFGYLLKALTHRVYQQAVADGTAIKDQQFSTVMIYILVIIIAWIDDVQSHSDSNKSKYDIGRPLFEYRLGCHKRYDTIYGKPPRQSKIRIIRLVPQSHRWVAIINRWAWVRSPTSRFAVIKGQSSQLEENAKMAQKKETHW